VLKCAKCGAKRKSYGSLVEKPETRKPLGRSRGRREDIIKLDLKEIGYGSVLRLSCSRRDKLWYVVNTVM
jgi:hypothetical protein